MAIKIFLPGRLEGMNEVIDANRASKYAGAELKRTLTEALAWQIKAERLPQLSGPRHYRFTWYEANRRRDPDNIASSVKFIFDGMKQAGVIENDGWGQVASIHHEFAANAGPVGVQVEIIEE